MAGSLHAITMPKWGMTMTEGRLGHWLGRLGDEIEAGQELVEIETEKITNVVDSSVSGRLCRILVDKGESAPVGALIGVLAEGEVSEAEIEAFVASYAGRGGVLSSAAEDASPAPRRLEVGPHLLNVLSLGDGDAVPVVLLHGFGSDHRAWLFNQDALAALRPVHLLDLPAHGGSAPSVPSGALDDLTAAVGDAIEALEIDRVHLVGHSLGGAIAIATAAAMPGRVASLALIAPAGLGPEISAGFIDGFLAAERRNPMRATLASLFADPSLVTAEMIQNVLRFKRADGVLEALHALADHLVVGGRQGIDLRGRLAGLGLPRLVIWGEEDAIIPSAQAEGLPPEIRVERIARAGHMPMMETAAAVNRLLAEWFAEAGRG